MMLGHPLSLSRGVVASLEEGTWILAFQTCLQFQGLGIHKILSSEQTLGLLGGGGGGERKRRQGQ